MEEKDQAAIDAKTANDLIETLKDIAGVHEGRTCEGYFWLHVGKKTEPKRFGYMDKFGSMYPADAQEMALRKLREYNLIPQV